MSTLATLRQEIGNRTKSYVAGTTTTTVTTDDQVIDSKLAGLGYGDDYFNGWYVWINTTANASVRRLVEDYTDSTGALTIAGANLAAESAAGTAFELHKFDPADILRAINNVLTKEYDAMFNEVVDITTTTAVKQTRYPIPTGVLSPPKQVLLEQALSWDFDENLLDNGGFEDWTVDDVTDDWGVPTGMTETMADVDEITVKYGSYCAKEIVTASTAASKYQTISTPANYDSQKLCLAFWVYCTTASRVKVEIKDNTGSTASSFHQGKGWERLVAVHNVCVSPTSVQAGVTCASGTSITIYLDNAYLVRSSYYPSRYAKTIYNWHIEGNDIVLEEPLIADRALIVIGGYPFTALSADTDTLSPDDNRLEIIYSGAIFNLYKGLRAVQTGKTQNLYDDDISFWGGELARMKALYGKQPASRNIPVGLKW